MNVYVIALIIFVVLGVLSTFFGYVHSLGKSFESTPIETNQTESSIDASEGKKQQQSLAEDAEAQRRAYMENIKQKMRDSQRR